jgi:hypothetical protein
MNMKPRLEPPPPGPPAPPSGDSRILHHDVGQTLLQPEHGLKRGVRGRPRRADHETAVIDRKIALRRLDIERYRQRDGGKEHDHC